MGTEKKSFKQKMKGLWNYFTTYEKIWFASILVLAVVFSFLFPETDDPDYTVTLSNSAYNAEVTSADTLSFEGSMGSFVIEEIVVGNYVAGANGQLTFDGVSYDMSYVKKNLSEFTVTDEDPSTLTLKLPVTVTANECVQLICYPDTDNCAISVKLCSDNDVMYTQRGIVLAGDVLADKYVIIENSAYPDGVLFSGAQKLLLITILYLLDVILNVACELLISKQSKWNFIVSLGVEVVEILVCVLCVYRFATMATTLLFWIPCDIISFIIWHKHPDQQDEEVTVVKKLTPLQDVLIIAGIILWTVGVGYLLTFVDVPGGIFANNVTLKNVVCYLDACASAVGIVNGVLILLRYREQWIAWYICAIIETVINVMAGQWVLLVLKLGYLTNTTYGYIKWTKYINSHKQQEQAQQPQQVNA